MNVVYLQCGWEDECKTKDCMDCPRKKTITIEITEAEACCVEDFATVDIDIWLQENPEDFELSQDVMRQLMTKIFGALDD